MDEMIDALQEIARELRSLNSTLERMDDGLFSLNLHVGADVSAWTESHRDQGQGIVKWFDIEKGVGFITQTGGGPDVFVHSSVIPPPGFLQAGQEVAFEMAEGSRGPIAMTLELA